MFDYIAPIPIDMQVLLLLDANICKDTDSYGSIPIVLAWDHIVRFGQYQPLLLLHCFFCDSTNQAQGEISTNSHSTL